YMRVGSLAASALVSGDVNAVLTSSNAVLNLAAGGLDVVIIGALFQRPEGDFMARPEIKKPDDLKGKQLAIQSIGGGGWANNMLAMDYLGLDPDRDNIRFIVLGDQPSRIQALETGRAQASWMGSTFSAPLKKKGYTLLVDLSRAPIPYVGFFKSRKINRLSCGSWRGICALTALKTRKPDTTPWWRRTAMISGPNPRGC